MDETMGPKVTADKLGSNGDSEPFAPNELKPDKSSKGFVDEWHRGFAKDYIKEVLTNVRDVETQLRRSLLLVVSLAFVFAISTSNPRFAITVFTLRLDNATPLLAIIPPVTAYQAGHILILFRDLAHTGAMAGDAVRQVFPHLADSVWDSALITQSRVFGMPMETRGGALWEIAQLALRMLILLVGPFVLSAVEVVLYGANVGWSSLSFILSAVAVVVLLVPGIASLVQFGRNLAN